jgi:hypothetical protein
MQLLGVLRRVLLVRSDSDALVLMCYALGMCF